MRMNRKLKHFLVLVLAMTVLLCAVMPVSHAESLRRGSRGDLVTTLQKRLKTWGYYTGNVDGIFGSQTEQAVKYFQRKNGLAADGIVGPATAKAVGISLTGGSSGGSSSSSGTGSSSSDVYLLARCVYGEARGESYKGQVAVAAVVLNRVRSSSFPNTISGVIYQPGAFSVVSDGQINLTPNDTARGGARDAKKGGGPAGGCLDYSSPGTTSNKWILSRPIMMRIGNHVFCK